MKGQAAFHRQFQTAPREVAAEVERELPRLASGMIGEMRTLVRSSSGVLEESIGWSWGGMQPGSVTIKKRGGREYGKILVVLYAGVPTGGGPLDPYYGRWVEFGTEEAPAHPFFWPVFRANASRVRAGLTRAVNRGFKKSRAR